MARGLTIAVWIFAVNAMFTILKAINPFKTELDYTLGTELINASIDTSTTTEISFLDPGTIVMMLNTFLDLILGPFTLAPQLMSMIGIPGIIIYPLTGCLWMIYSYFLFQLVTGRVLGDVK